MAAAHAATACRSRARRERRGRDTLAVAADDSVHVVRARDGAQLMAVSGGGLVLALSGDGSELSWSDGTFGRILSTDDGRVLGQGSMPAGRNGLT